MAHRSLHTHISKKTYQGPKGKYWLWRVAIPVFDELGLPRARVRRSFPASMSRRQVEEMARQIQEHLSGKQAAAQDRPMLLATCLQYHQAVTHGPQPKAERTAVMDWTAIRYLALWLLDREGQAMTPLDHLGPVAEQGRRVQRVADAYDLALADFRRAQAEDLRDYLARRQGATSVNIYLRHLSSMVSWAVGRELTDRNPLAGLPRMDPRKATAGGQGTPERTAYSATDVRRILEAAHQVDPELGRYCGLLAWTAMRPGALIQLLPAGIDLARGIIQVPAVKGQPGHSIPLVAPARPYAEAHTAPWTHREAWYARQVRTIVARLGIIISRPLYGFRHGWGTQAVEAGLPIRWVSRYMGHSTVATTERWYDHSRLVEPDPPAPEMLTILAGLGQEAGK